jgi:hypothetical protein
MDVGSAIGDLDPLAFGKSLLSTAVNLAFPNYGFYNGRGYGLRQFPNSVPNPLNRLDQAGLNHDRAFRHLDWVRDAWSPSTPGLATGPLGLAYQTLGTPFFALGGAFQ